MSQENVEIIRRGHEAFNRGDLDAVVADLAPEFEYVTSGVITDAGRGYRGAEEYRQLLEGLFFAEFSEVRVEGNEFIDVGDQVLVAVTMHGRGKRSGAETSWSFFQVSTLREGMVTRGEGFENRAEALEALGMRE